MQVGVDFEDKVKYACMPLRAQFLNILNGNKVGSSVTRIISSGLDRCVPAEPTVTMHQWDHDFVNRDGNPCTATPMRTHVYACG